MKNGAKDLIIFPWEEVEKEAEKEINETEVECFENLLKQGKNIFKSYECGWKSIIQNSN